MNRRNLTSAERLVLADKEAEYVTIGAGRRPFEMPKAAARLPQTESLRETVDNHAIIRPKKPGMTTHSR